MATSTGSPQGQPSSTTSSTAISSSEAASGIKQALSQGLDRSIKSLAVRDGFLGNAAVKILMPPEAQKVESALRGIGLGSLCDNLIQSLNRAAESAVSEATPVFVSALSQLTIRDATNILLSGQPDAATDFFKRATTTELTKRFSPIVEGALGKYKVAQYWSAVVSKYNQIPLVNDKIETDLNKYVTQKAIEGLFLQVAAEELKIRNNLGGTRTTPLLQKVFGYADKQKK
ncbi:DUF4197 domain-containing protein [Parapedobacter sp. GCM10030251]|uniref:DUF4197 domain-containing protein n=1 Tax=Parapedobacter sp. GCM10030251 TaxID=3273419 RepID=UPI00361FDACC